MRSAAARRPSSSRTSTPPTATRSRTASCEAPVWQRFIEALKRWWTGYDPPLQDAPLPGLDTRLANILNGATPAGRADHRTRSPTERSPGSALERGHPAQRSRAAVHLPGRQDALRRGARRDDPRHGHAPQRAEPARGLRHLHRQSGTDTAPEIALSLTKTLSGTTGFTTSFDAFGGHVSLSGTLDASVDLALNLTAGVNATEGFYIVTDGLGAELSLSNIQVTGQLDGGGQFGIIGVELVSSDLQRQRRQRQRRPRRALGHEDPSRRPGRPVVARGAHRRSPSTGPASGDAATLTAGIQVSAMLPGECEPFTIAGAGITSTGPTRRSPPRVTVDYNGGIGDFLKLRMQELARQADRAPRRHAIARRDRALPLRRPRQRSPPSSASWTRTRCRPRPRRTAAELRQTLQDLTGRLVAAAERAVR